MKWRFAQLGLLLALTVIWITPARADSVVSVHIYDELAGTEVTASPAPLVLNTLYFLTSDENNASHPTRMELDLGAAKGTIWNVVGQGYASHHVTGGNVSCSWTSNKYSCTASGGDWLAEVHIEAYAAGGVVLATMVGRTASPTGLDTRQYSIN